MSRQSLSIFPKDYDPIDIAWAAGLFEGEGCIFRDPRRNNIGLMLQMTDQEIVERFARVIGGPVTGPFLTATTLKKFPNAKSIWRWRCASKAYVQRFTEVVGPHLGTQKRDLLYS